MMLLWINTWGQQVIEVPGQIFQGKHFDFTTTIKNYGNSPAEFVPVWKYPEPEALISDSAYIASLQGLSKIDIIKKAGGLLKSCQYLNGQFIQNENYSPDYEEVYERKYTDLTGRIVSQYHAKCNDYWRFFAQTLMQTGNFDEADFREVAVQGHTFGEVKIDGVWVMVDCDPGMPGALITPYSGSVTGYASYADIRQFPALITQYESIPFWSTENHYIPNDTAYYKYILTEQSYVDYPVDFPEIPEAPSTEKKTFILCPDCEISWHLSGYYADVATPGGKQLRDSLQLLINMSAAGHPVEADIANLLNNYFELNLPANTYDLLRFVVDSFYLKNDQYLGPILGHTAPLNTLQLTIPPASSGYELGRDVQLPYLINSIDISSGQFTLEGRQFGQGSYDMKVFDPWSDDFVGDHQDIAYLKDGNISSGAKINFSMTYNPQLLDFAFGFNINQLGTPDTLSIQTWSSVISDAPQAVKADHLQVYPNPNNGTFTCSTSDINILDISGRKVQYTQVGNQISIPTAGIYFVISNDGTATQKVIVTR